MTRRRGDGRVAPNGFSTLYRMGWAMGTFGVYAAERKNRSARTSFVSCSAAPPADTGGPAPPPRLEPLKPPRFLGSLCMMRDEPITCAVETARAETRHEGDEWWEPIIDHKPTHGHRGSLGVLPRTFVELPSTAHPLLARAKCLTRYYSQRRDTRQRRDPAIFWQWRDPVFFSAERRNGSGGRNGSDLIRRGYESTAV